MRHDGYIEIEGKRIMAWVLTEKGERILRMAEAGEGLVEEMPPPDPQPLIHVLRHFE